MSTSESADRVFEKEPSEESLTALAKGLGLSNEAPEVVEEGDGVVKLVRYRGELWYSIGNFAKPSRQVYGEDYFVGSTRREEDARVRETINDLYRLYGGFNVILGPALAGRPDVTPEAAVEIARTMDGLYIRKEAYERVQRGEVGSKMTLTVPDQSAADPA